MLATANRYWWVFLLRGIFSILFGLAALFWPGITLQVLILWFAAFTLVGGIFTLINAFRAMGHHRQWWMLLLEGIIGIGAGLYAFFLPGATAVILLYIIAAWAIATGILEMIAAFTSPWPGGSKFLLALNGLLSIGLGVIFFMKPLVGLITVIWITGAYALGFGIFFIILAIRLKTPNAAAGIPQPD